MDTITSAAANRNSVSTTLASSVLRNVFGGAGTPETDSKHVENLSSEFRQLDEEPSDLAKKVLTRLESRKECAASQLGIVADEVDYEKTKKGEPEKGSVISQKSLSTLISKIIHSPERHSRQNMGVNKPSY